VDVCEGDGASGAPMAAPDHQPATFIPLPVNAGRLLRRSEPVRTIDPSIDPSFSRWLPAQLTRT